MCEVVPVVKKKGSRCFKVATYPNRRVQGGGQPVARFDRGNKASLKRQRRIQPHIGQQHVT